MFWRKSKSASPVASRPDGDPWDEATINDLGKSDLNVRLAHIERRFEAGRGRDGLETIFTGFVAGARQHVHLEITFDADLKKIGEASLSYYIEMKHPSGAVNLPIIRVVLRDQDNSLRTGMVEALRDSLAAGRKFAEARFFMRLSNERREGVRPWFEINGANVWANMHSPTLPMWALPIGEIDLSNHPDASKLRLAGVSVGSSGENPA